MVLLSNASVRVPVASYVALKRINRFLSERYNSVRKASIDKMAVTLYYMDGSPPCHRVFLTAKILKVDLNLKPLDYMKKEHLAPEFLKINPQHIVPTLVDGDFVLWESRAVCRYLVYKYGPSSKLYPQDARARALVDQRLDFDYKLYDTFADYFYPQFEGGSLDPAKLKKIEEALGFLNIFLEGGKYVAGGDFTIADCALVSTVAVIEAAEVTDLKPYTNILKWLQLVKTSVPEYKEAIEKNVEIFKSLLSKT